MTVFDTFDHLREPGLLRTAEAQLDGVAEVSSGPAAGMVRLVLSSGDEVDVHLREDAGTLRLTTGGPPGTSPLLVDHPTRPVGVEPRTGGVTITGSAWTATWTAEDGLVLGPYRTAPSSGLGGDAPALFGRYHRDGQTLGWLISAQLADGDAVYGGGESFRSVDQRGTTRGGINVETHGIGGLDAVYLNVPFYWSVPAIEAPGWGLLAHTGEPVTADIGATHGDVAAFVVGGDELDLFVFSGRPAECLAAYHRLSGLPGSFPSWAMGTWTSRCSYFDEAELHAIVDGYAAADIPVDVVHVDCWGEGNAIQELTCSWEVDRQRFPEGWIGRLEDRGVRVSLWHNPYLLAGSALADRFERRGWLLLDDDGTPAKTPDKHDRVVIDLTNPAAVDWWTDQVRELVREGAASLKPDFGEEIPLGAIAHDGRRGRQIRNAYSVWYQQATYAAMADATDDAAVALFCRSGTTGAQRFPCHWVGDTPSTWAGLTQALRACLSMSLTGFGVVTSDAGGFHVAESWPRLVAAAAAEDGSVYEADVDAELFLRWAQWGAFSPVLRFHGTGRREPWAYPEPVASLAGEAVRLRHALRPYLETVAHASATEGTPMMRPLPLTDPHLPGASASLQYLLGDDILVAPLTDPSGLRRVYVPAGEWVPLLGLDPVTGPGWVTVTCELAQFPVWARAETTAARLAAT